jgi:hypothetical protein
LYEWEKNTFKQNAAEQPQVISPLEMPRSLLSPSLPWQGRGGQQSRHCMTAALLSSLPIAPINAKEFEWCVLKTKIIQYIYIFTATYREPNSTQSAQFKQFCILF